MSTRYRKFYQLNRLLSRRTFANGQLPGSSEHIICDIDKTYLETAFESLVKLAKIPFENPSDKITVRGMAPVLVATRWGVADGSLAIPQNDIPRMLHFVSSSPPMLRRVIQEKMFLDGLDWTSDHFKNQTYNLIKGRFDLLRHQVAYKTTAILSALSDHELGRIIMIGDNAESDPFIYFGIKLLLEGRLDLDAFQEYIEIGGVESEVSSQMVQELANRDHLPRGIVSGIMIRELPSYPVKNVSPLTETLFFYRNSFELALELWRQNFIQRDSLWPLIKVLHNEHDFCLSELTSTLETLNQKNLTKELAETRNEILEHLAVFTEPADFKADLNISPTREFPCVNAEALDDLRPDEILSLAKRWHKLAFSTDEAAEPR